MELQDKYPMQPNSSESLRSLSCTQWLEAHSMYDWRVDLKTFKEALKYPMHFERVIHPENLKAFEDGFREAIEDDGSYVSAGEVTYWKLYGSFQSRNKISSDMLSHLEDLEMWESFRLSLIHLAQQSSFDSFKLFHAFCNMPNGFAVPITFLSFYKPSEYPMADKIIAYWWRDHKAEYGFEDAPVFSQRADDGWIETTSGKKLRQNWQAYLAWTEFCRQQALWISEECQVDWRPRDVEMAVWMMWKEQN